MDEPTSTAPSASPIPPTLAPGPALWNPNAASAWSLLFSPAFGAYLQARNAEALGQTEQAKLHQKWFYGVLIAFVVLPILIFLPGGGFLTRILGLGLLLAWYFSLGAKQVKFVKDTYGDAYPRKAWGTPIVIGIAGIVVYLIYSFVLGFIAALVLGLRPG